MDFQQKFFVQMHSIFLLQKVYENGVTAVTLSSFRAITGQSTPFTLWISPFFVTGLSTGLSAMSCWYRYVVTTAELSTGLLGFEQMFDYTAP